MSDPFDSLESTLNEAGAEAALDSLVESLRADGKLPELFEALLMRRRHSLGLPLRGNESLRELPDDVQETVEKAYVEICREIGALFLAKDDIPGAWPYYRAIDETKEIAAAVDAWTPSEDEDETDDASAEYDPYDENAIDLCDSIVDIAFHQGANPVRGYELILSQYGTCRAVTIFEHQFPHPEPIREQCGKKLVRHLYDELLHSLRCDLEGRGVEPAKDATVRSLVEAHPELFDEHGYHIDISHLQATVRGAASLGVSEELDLALQMCEYGRRLAKDFQTEDRAPFDDFYNDYRILLRAYLGEGIDGAVRYFRRKADQAGIDENGQHFPGEVVVHLLHRVGRPAEAIEAYQTYLGDLSSQTTLAPSLATLCTAAQEYAAILEASRGKDDLLQYTAALIERSEAGQLDRDGGDEDSAASES